MLGMCIFFVAGSLAAIIFATPWFALALVPTGAIYVYINRYFRNAAREIVSRSCPSSWERPSWRKLDVTLTRMLPSVATLSHTLPSPLIPSPPVC